MGTRLQDLPRDKRLMLRRLFKRSWLDNPWRLPQSAPRRYLRVDVDTNAWARRIIDAHARNGRIGFIRSGMDCDCTQYYAESTMSIDGTVAGFLRWYNGYLEGLEGPDSHRFCDPDQIEPVYRTRDRAMEAYEDGHISTVIFTMGDDLSGEY